MDWNTLRDQIAPDTHYPLRTRRLVALDAVLDGTQYDHIVCDFSTEEAGGQPVPIEQRRPRVKTNLCRVTVDQAISLLFSEGRFPRVLGKDAESSSRLAEIVKSIGLPAAMYEAALFGSVGSVAILVRFMAGKVFIEPKRTAFLTPRYDPADPSRLVSVVERYKATGKDLAALGFKVPSERATYWFSQEWTDEHHVIYRPEPLVREDGKDSKPRRLRATPHNLARVPIVWVKNLPGGIAPDGDSTFEHGIDSVIALDYMESQADRAMRYTGDPMLVVTGDDGLAGAAIPKGANTVLTIPDPTASVKLLEMDGGSSVAFNARGQALRRTALEAMHGNRANPDKISAATSGRMMELLHQDQIWLADRLRVAYGDALMAVLALVGHGMRIYDAMAAGTKIAPFGTDDLSLSWGAWFDPTYGDIVSFTSGVSNAVQGGFLSHETATRVVGPTFDVPDVAAERRLIDAEQAAQQALLAKQAAQVTASTTEPS